MCKYQKTNKVQRAMDICCVMEKRVQIWICIANETKIWFPQTKESPCNCVTNEPSLQQLHPKSATKSLRRRLAWRAIFPTASFLVKIPGGCLFSSKMWNCWFLLYLPHFAQSCPFEIHKCAIVMLPLSPPKYQFQMWIPILTNYSKEVCHEKIVFPHPLLSCRPQ